MQFGGLSDLFRYLIPVGSFVVFISFASIFCSRKNLLLTDVQVFLLGGIFLWLILSVIVVIIASISIDSYSGVIHTLGKVFVAFLAFSVGCLIPSFLGRVDVNRLFNAVYATFFLFLSFEFLSRLLLSSVDFGNGLYFFYALKVETFFAADTNSLAIVIVLFLCIHYGLIDKVTGDKRWVFWGCIIFVFLTFSRSSWVALISLFLALGLAQARKNLLFYIFFVILFACIVLISYYIFIWFLSDYSFRTRVEIFSKLPELFFSYDVLPQLFGFGVQDGARAYSFESGRHAHALFPMLLGQLGIIGSVIYGLLCAGVLWTGKFKSFILLLAVFMMGLSYFIPLYETFFFAAGLIAALGKSYKVVQT